MFTYKKNKNKNLEPLENSQKHTLGLWILFGYELHIQADIKLSLRKDDDVYDMKKSSEFWFNMIDLIHPQTCYPICYFALICIMC